MNLLRWIRDWFFKRALRKILNEGRLQPEDISPYNPGKRILLLYDYTTTENRQPVQRFVSDLRNQGKAVIVQCYLHEKAGEVKNIPHKVISRSDINLFEIPKKKLDLMEEKRFDLLINLDRSGRRPLTFVAAAANSAFKVGFTFSPYPEIYELMVEQDAGKDLGRLIEDVRKVVNTISGSPEPLGFL